MQVTISLAQIDIVFGDPAANLQKAAALVAEAKRRGSDLVVFPEMWTTGFDWKNLQALAAWQDDVVSSIAKLARQHSIWLTGSLLALNNADQPTNNAILFDPTGQAVASYHKIHLFSLMDEDHYLAPGQELTLVETSWGPTGLAICYDLRFTEMFRSYALQGATMVVLPAQWPYPRLAHWRTLLRARAIENQMYVIGVNRIGSDPISKFVGHSAVIDPWGNTVVEAGETEVLLTATIETEQVIKVRQKIPVFRDRRPELYRLHRK